MFPYGVEMKVLSIFLLLLATVSTIQAQTADLFISEYVEGSSNNKALEIFNGTANSIDIGNYQLLRYSNGSNDPATIALNTQILDPGEAFVIVHEFAESTLLDLADQSTSELNFSGNDALVLTQGTRIIDSFGQVGFDPGSAWTCDDGSTINQTLVRLSDVCQGDTIIDDVFDPCDEYEFHSLDTFSGLGSHATDCHPVSNGRLGWDALKAQYR
jgi:uncharacterized protein